VQKHIQPDSFLHQSTLDLSHNPKCIPNKLQTIGGASDGFTYRRNRPWPRSPHFWGPRATLSYGNSIL